MIAYMTDTPAPNAVLDEATATFIQRNVSIIMATTNAEKRPTVTRVYGCRVAADGGSITLYIASTYNAVLLENIRATRNIAVVFSQPNSHKTIQLKGNDAEIASLETADQPVIENYFKLMIEELTGLGYPDAFARAMVQPPEKLDTAIRFTPLTAFSQTPGPDAGKKLSA